MTAQLTRAAFATLVTCALISCSPADEGPAQEETPTDSAAATSNIIGLDLAPLTEADIASADLPDELACAFSEGANTLLFARSFVGEAETGAAIVRLNGEVIRLAAPHEGGFGAMEQRGEFVGQNIEIDVEPTSGNRAEHEGSAYDAILTVLRGDRANLAVQGEWSCGP